MHQQIRSICTSHSLPAHTQARHPYLIALPRCLIRARGPWGEDGTSAPVNALLFPFPRTQPFPWLKALICTQFSHYCVFGRHGRMCLYLHLSNSELLASSNVLDAAISGNRFWVSDGFPAAMAVIPSVTPQGCLAVVTVETLRNFTPVLLFYCLQTPQQPCAKLKSKSDNEERSVPGQWHLSLL